MTCIEILVVIVQQGSFCALSSLPICELMKLFIPVRKEKPVHDFHSLFKHLSSPCYNSHSIHLAADITSTSEYNTTTRSLKLLKYRSVLPRVVSPTGMRC